MARLARLFVPDVPLHVIVRGNDRQDIFRSEGDRIYFHRLLATLAAETAVAVHAYVLMTNHVHLLATGRHPGSLPLLMQRLGRRYVGYFNYLHGRTGGLWEGRYKSCPVETERYFLTCQRYIELNPVRAGLVGHPAMHPWSSYRFHAEGVCDDVVTPHPMVHALGLSSEDRQLAYRGLFDADLDADTLKVIRDTVQHGWALGGKGFCESLTKTGVRRPQRSRRGRRPKQPELAQMESDPIYLL